MITKEQLSKYISKSDLDKIDIKKYQLDLDNYVTQKEKCSTCSSINECTSSTLGKQPVIKITNNKLYTNVKDCDYFSQYRQTEALKEKISYVFFSDKYKEANMKNIIKNDKRKEVVKYIEYILDNVDNNQPLKGLYLHGGVGAGKSYMMSALANELSQKGKRCLIVYFPDFIRSIKSAIGNNTVEKNLNLLKKVDCLFIDDIGVDHMSDWVKEEIFNPLINYRQANDLFTCFTSNYPSNEIYKSYAITSKTNEKDYIKAAKLESRICALCTEISLEDKDYRN